MKEKRLIPLRKDTTTTYYQASLFLNENNSIVANEDKEANDLSIQLNWKQKLNLILKYLKEHEKKAEKIKICFEVINTLLDFSNPINLSHLTKENKITLLQILIELLTYYQKNVDTEEEFFYLSTLLFHINFNYLEKYFDYQSNKPYEGIDQGSLGLIRSQYYLTSGLKKRTREKN